jgi:hypothetical protein
MSVPYALYASKTDTSSLNLAGRFSGKLNVADTASMLSNYKNELNNKVNTSDTFFMLTNYWTGLNNKVNISDTSTMLSPYLRKVDAMVNVETDPVFNTSIAKGISSIDTAYWNRKTGNVPGNIQYWNGTTWVNLAPGLPGQILSTDNTGKPVWLSTLPLISTNSVSDINPNTATCGGNITSDGGSPVTGRGVVWSINPNPTISLSTKTSNGLGIGAFTSSMTGLTSNVVYYVRAHVTNSVGTIYGNEIVFTTTANIPTLTTTSVQSITTNGAISGGNISSDGGSI